MRRGDKKFASNTSCFVVRKVSPRRIIKKVSLAKGTILGKMLFHRSFPGQRIVKHREKEPLEEKLVKTAQFDLLWCHQK